MSGSNGRCCTSEPDRLTLDGPVEEDGAGLEVVIRRGRTDPAGQRERGRDEQRRRGAEGA